MGVTVRQPRCRCCLPSLLSSAFGCNAHQPLLIRLAWHGMRSPPGPASPHPHTQPHPTPAGMPCSQPLPPIQPLWNIPCPSLQVMGYNVPYPFIIGSALAVAGGVYWWESLHVAREKGGRGQRAAGWGGWGGELAAHACCKLRMCCSASAAAHMPLCCHACTCALYTPIRHAVTAAPK